MSTHPTLVAAMLVEVCDVPCLRLSALLEMGRPSSLDQWK